MGKEEFLRLLVTQLSNQDPLNPMDGQQFAAQLAQFTSVEQLINIKDSLALQSESQGLLAQSINSGVAAGLIGKEVSAGTDAFTLGATGDVPLAFSLDASATSVDLVVRDASGEVVRTLSGGSYDAGSHTLDWNGTDDAGNRLPEGAYTFSIEAKDGADNPVNATSIIRGIVDRVSFGADGIQLWVGGSSLPMSAVRSVEGG